MNIPEIVGYSPFLPDRTSVVFDNGQEVILNVRDGSIFIYKKGNYSYPPIPDELLISLIVNMKYQRLHHICSVFKYLNRKYANRG